MSVPKPDTAAIRTGEDFDHEALATYLRGRLAGAEGPIEVEQFPGGHSNLTYLLRFGGREFVMRRPPMGPVAPTAHDMVREYRVLSAVHPVFPLAPRPELACEDVSILGVPFYVMERRRGIIVRTEVPKEVGNDEKLRRRISEAMVDTLVALHAIDIEASGLARLGKPQGFVERQVRGWTERWTRAKTTEVPAMERVITWLAERIPPAPAATMLHNDFKLDNVMLDRADPGRVAAVLDWEMATVGDPLVDLGLLLCYWSRTDDPKARRDAVSSVTTQPGWLSRDEIIQRYAERTGRDLSRIAFYETFALFKVAVVIQQIFFRYQRGQTRDERFADFERRVIGLAEAALEVAERSVM
jgi:aminoglycoside phosphotransferase (APT) family kinase protein